MSRRSTAQPDLFALETQAAPEAALPPEVDEAFLAAVRTELAGLMAKAENAERLPWRDFTASAVAELRFEGMLRWLPAEEAADLSARFAAELDRLYAAG